MIVLSRGDDAKGMPPEFEAADQAAMKTVWTALHRDMTALSKKGENREVAGAGHSIQADAPQAVTAAIGMSLRRCGQSPDPNCRGISPAGAASAIATGGDDQCVQPKTGNTG